MPKGRAVFLCHLVDGSKLSKRCPCNGLLTDL
nr:MAG TPA: hypothetical protein [Caudoviricetes sp.]